MISQRLDEVCEIELEKGRGQAEEKPKTVEKGETSPVLFGVLEISEEKEKSSDSSKDDRDVEMAESVSLPATEVHFNSSNLCGIEHLP